MKRFQKAICLGIAVALALPVALPAAAQDGLSTIELLAQASGLTTRQVKMVLGNPTAFAEYRTSYAFVDRQFRDAVGPEIYRNLKERGELSARNARELAALARARTSVELASK